VRESADSAAQGGQNFSKKRRDRAIENSCRAPPCFEHKIRLSTAQSILLKNFVSARCALTIFTLNFEEYGVWHSVRRRKSMPI
jgi:hypothetical protein